MDDPENTYYPDAIEKYFRRPHGNDFEHLKFGEYYQLYQIRTATNRAIRDLDGRIVIKRKKPTLTRTRFLKLNDGESFFYNRLLQTKSWRSEDELSGPYDSYREHYLCVNKLDHI